jgi:hypothetical protein
VAVAVMEVGVVRVLVPQRLVAVHVAVRFRHRASMLMLVMRVMHVAVIVFDFIVNMFMLMAFRQVKPEPECHQAAGCDQPWGYRIAQHDD